MTRSMQEVTTLSELKIRGLYDLAGSDLQLSVLYPFASYWKVEICASKNVAAFVPGCR